MFAAKAFTITSFILAGAKALQVSTPDNVLQCGDTQITVSDATGQYHVEVVPVEDPCESDALFESEPLTNGSYTWKTKLPTGTQAMIFVNDEAGNEAWSGAFTVGAGDSSCLDSPSPSDAYSSASSASTSVSGTYTPAAAPTNDVVINNIPASTSSSPFGQPPANVQQGNGNQRGNTPATGAAFSDAHANLFTTLAAIGVVAMAL